MAAPNTFSLLLQHIHTAPHPVNSLHYDLYGPSNLKRSETLGVERSLLYDIVRSMPGDPFESIDAEAKQARLEDLEALLSECSDEGEVFNTA